MRLLLTLFFVLGSFSAWSANTDYRAFLTNWFTTNNFYIGINTNPGSSTYQFTTNLIQNSASPQVFTNEMPTAPFIYPSGTGPNHPDGSAPGPPFVIRGDGAIFLGTNVNQDVNEFPGINSLYFPYAVTMTDSNEPPNIEQLMQVLDSENYGFYSEYYNLVHGDKDDGNITSVWEAFTTNGHKMRLQFFITPTGGDVPIALSVNNARNFTINTNGDLSMVKSVGYSWPLTNALPGQVWASGGGTPQQLYWTNLPAAGITGGTTNFATTNSNTGLTNAIQSIITNFTTTAAFTNEIQSISTNVAVNTFSNQIPNFIRGRTNYLALFNPNTNTVSQSIMFQTNGTTDIAMRNGDSPDGTLALRFIMYGHYGSESTKDWLEANWNVGQGEYQILTQKGSGGTTRRLSFGTGGTLYWNISTTGHLLPNSNNASDIGAGSDGVRRLYVEDFIQLDQDGTAGAAQIGNRGNPNGSGFTFEGGTIGIVNGTAGVDEMKIYATGLSFAGANRGLIALGNGYISTGSSSANNAAFFGTDPVNTVNRWQVTTNNVTATTQGAVGQLVGSSGSGSHMYGGDIAIYGGVSTGSGTNGSLILGTAEGGAAISTLNTVKIRQMASAEPVILTDNSATIVCTVSNITSGYMAGVKVSATTKFESSAGTNVVTEEFRIAAANIGGTLQTPVVSASSPIATYNSSGTATTTWTAVANNNGFDIKCNAHTSLSSPTDKTRWRIEIDSDTVPHVYADGYRHTGQ